MLNLLYCDSLSFLEKRLVKYVSTLVNSFNKSNFTQFYEFFYYYSEDDSCGMFGEELELYGAGPS